MRNLNFYKKKIDLKDTMIKLIKMVKFSKLDFFELEECKCNKPLFRFHDTSKNTYIAKCAYTTIEYDLKLKSWVTSKKQPCDFIGYYQC